MAEVLTIDEINRLHPDEWVLIGDPETTDSLEVLSGTVLWHSKDRDEDYRKSAELKPPYAAFHFSGSLFDPDLEYFLTPFFDEI